MLRPREYNFDNIASKLLFKCSTFSQLVQELSIFYGLTLPREVSGDSLILCQI